MIPRNKKVRMKKQKKRLHADKSRNEQIKKQMNGKKELVVVTGSQPSYSV